MKERVKKIIASHLDVPPETIEESGDLVDDYGADSLDVVELAMALEDEFGLDIPDKDVYGFSTVRDIIHYVNTHKVA